MPASSSRRNWLKNTALTLTGLGLGPGLAFAEQGVLQPGKTILLNSNESPYGPSPAVKKAMANAMLTSNRYPDEAIAELKKELAAFWQVIEENILLGAGSSELLGLSFLLASNGKKNIVTADPCYSVWHRQATACGLNINKVPLTIDKTLDLNTMLNTAGSETGMVYICNPNNPVGTHVADQSLRNFAMECSKKTMVLIDEAYTEFNNLPSLKDIAIANPNVIVAKTFSKVYGLAGARIGYAIAHADTIKKLSNLQPWPDGSISAVTAAAASAALKDQAFVQQCRSDNAAVKEKCYKTFGELKLEYIPSVTNFILFNIDKLKGDFQQQMEARNIAVQYRNHFGGKWCRVSMGTAAEMNQFCAALKSIAG